MWNKVNMKTLWLVVWNLSLGFQLLKALPLPQNALETFAVGALSLAGSAAEIFQNGAALHKEGGLETSLFKLDSKTAVGMGEALRNKADTDSDEDSDEDRRRRKRFAVAELQDLLPRPQSLAHPHAHRGKRSPCHTGTGGGTGGGTGVGTGTAPDYPVMDYDDLAERKRRQRKAARKRAASKKSGKKARSKTRKLTDDSSGARRRRQVEVDLTPTVDGAGKKISDYAKQFTEKVRGVWESVVSSMKGAVEQVKQKFGGGGGGNGTQSGAGMPTASDVEFV